MPPLTHIHTPDTARTLTLSGRNCLAASGMTTPPKIGYRRGKGREWLNLPPAHNGGEGRDLGGRR